MQFTIKFAFNLACNGQKTVGKESFIQKYLELMGGNDNETMELIDFVFSLCDTNNNNQLEEEEFKHFMYSYNVYFENIQIETHSQICVAFFLMLHRAIDSDMNGFVSKSEIKECINKLTTTNYVIIKKYETSFKNLLQYCLNKGEGLVDLSPFEFLSVALKRDILMNYLTEKNKYLFSIFDCDKNKSLSVSEINKVLLSVFPRGIEDKNASEIFIKLIQQNEMAEKMDNQFFGFFYEIIKDVKQNQTRLTHQLLLEIVVRLCDFEATGMLGNKELKTIVNVVCLDQKHKKEILDLIGICKSIGQKELLTLLLN